ncbi:MAG: hypothetical protein A3B91_02495 [Candidatus Yanofskybacteria bacterium RIFCSPHIGHO2_02_FULL_41_29]|uniref:Methyltransferase type 12 domain-containing protein n=1 Tax=Candidatus Yanofskybacteria bacterium RIFCSPHIGHO2_01_FULL_41_53 TaxID=1802663 RepID=A0A1F8EJM9_9BACT|nr:MAG: hypothetical protein A2650_02995 [Candidatus Yanofskybacteria bacterium RIFCSPHIGHO2_01_FULL_41_53]OGN10308.1 MAG: hypothetical protein A3B91_02495 [Candidatus Yanofskybacteria bacterium RIFCSPHIGHO2_02_FULL_41_29]OGN16717.1 MAG: hypothetical protein A3F48_01615 [Candidatus Yanofskybacteria bacterium RIFCSPHIGHO2_12_FULL_41_9]OGN21833.1 MAG: hypothetical protein A2916_01045 [Candidatus Yanofskybacteria bacterium RIFCSPLOWO2_01_FULL_41_67]OGN30413.1 MAG: hypothetical protein A3H54_00070 
MFHKTQNKESLKIFLARMKGPLLTWVEQFLDLLEPHLTPSTTLNDIGCNVGQFYKGLVEKKIKIDYRGFDIEPIYLAQAKKIFPSAKNNFQILDITKETPPAADISVVSATLEHLENFSPALDHILASTKKIIIARTYLGEKQERDIMLKEHSQYPYPMNQYSFLDIFRTFAKYNFEAKIVRDRYTDSLPYYVPFETVPGQGLVRTQYVIVGRKTK